MERQGQRHGRVRSTIVDVARAAQVHPSTVSRALSLRPGHVLRAETRARVVAAADRLGYRPSALARSLRLQRTLTLGMLVPDIANTFLAGIIKGAEEAAHARGYSLVLCNTGDRPEREATYIRVLREREVDGMLVASTRMADGTIAALRADGFPFVLVNRAAGGEDDLVVTVDNAAAAGIVIDHLVSLGHRRIAHVAGPRSTTTGAERIAGVIAAGCHHGIEATIVETETWSLEGGHRAALELLRRDPPTAVFGANDLIALGVLRAARDAGLSIPADIALAGFNDTPEAALADLTTIHVAQEEMGARAAGLLIAQLEGEPIVERRLVLPARLIVRGSTGPARERPAA